MIRGQDPDTACVEHIALMYSNCGFIGIPMAQGLFGSEGVMYMTAYVAAANFLLWSHGVIVMSGEGRSQISEKGVYFSDDPGNCCRGIVLSFPNSDTGDG